MPSITVLLNPQIIGMRIFPELKDALKEAIFRVVGDMVPKENIEIASVYSGNTNDIEIIAGINWKRRPVFSQLLCDSLVTESHTAAVDCVSRNFPGTEASIRTIATAR